MTNGNDVQISLRLHYPENFHCFNNLMSSSQVYFEKVSHLLEICNIFVFFKEIIELCDNISDSLYMSLPYIVFIQK